MAAIASYVFLDLETTGLPVEECNKTRITELSLIAVKRSHVLETEGDSPRVQQKLTLCFNPRKFVSPISTEVTGLCNSLLEYETPFNQAVVDTINNFLSLLSKPICLVAQNGMNFDYPILKKHLNDLKVSFPEDLMCADSLHAFFDILSKNEDKACETSSSDNIKQIEEETRDELDFLLHDNPLELQKLNESTPKKCRCSTDIKTPSKVKQSLNCNRKSKVRRRIFWNAGSKPKQSYKLKDIYERVVNRPCLNSHRAESDCTMALECSVALAKDFVKWVDENHCLFAEVKPMTIGVPLGS